MSKLMVVSGRITVVTRDAEEDTEEYWDRAWAFARSISAPGGRAASAWASSLKAHPERRGVVY